MTTALAVWTLSLLALCALAVVLIDGSHVALGVGIVCAIVAAGIADSGREDS